MLLVDDHALVRRGFRRLLEDEPLITVVGEASDGDSAVRLARNLKPRVVVMDCALPGMNGLTATRRIVELRPNVAILMLSMHSEAHLVHQALEAGARGYVLKEALNLNLSDAIKRVAAGEIVLDPKVSHTTAEEAARPHGLSVRQLEVLQLICEGLSNQAIATKLGLSVNTVGVHRASIMKALRVHRAGELVAYAIRHRLVNVP